MAQNGIGHRDLPSPRYTYGGDDYVFVEIAEAMSFQANVRVQAITKEVNRRDIPGLIEVAPANASYLIQFDPGEIEPDQLIRHLKTIDEEIDVEAYTWDATVIEIPVLYDDPWTRDVLMDFRDRHQDPDSTDLEYAARINGFDSVSAFVDAHSGSPHMVSMIGFVPGLPWSYQMVPQDRQIEAPKYRQPRTDTPSRAIGFGGAFTTIYPARGAGGYQLFGRTPVEVLDTEQELPGFEESIVLPDPGDVIKFQQIDRDEYESIREDVEAGAYEYTTAQIEFVPEDFFADPDGYNDRIRRAIA